ncbi:MAG: selenide, water dikinase SelD [Planctomycetales bacterium]|nr:selenide, water dikinase SelD [Planctomycetales bacterium]
MERPLGKQHIVLMGIGHTNAHVLRMWMMEPLHDVDLTCITDNFIATYSGMLPAMLAGQIDKPAMEIDLVRLASRAGARLLRAKVLGLDLAEQRILLQDRPAIAFDALSIGIGSVPTTSGVTLQSDHLVKIKPMQTFVQRIEQALDTLPATNAEHLKVAVIGSGAAGVEIAFCLPNFLSRIQDRQVRIEMITRSQQVLPDESPRMRRLVQRALARRNIPVVSATVQSVVDRQIQLDTGETRCADLIIWATGATAPPILKTLGMPVDERGFLLTEHTLKSICGAPVFAVGDSGSIDGDNLPKAGVYAVRQAPILWENLKRQLTGRELREYRPQRNFLKLLNVGDGTAIGDWHGFALHNVWMKKLKDSIDNSFVEKYRPKPMAVAADMQCRGCGCKLGATSLASAIQQSGGTPLTEDASPIPGTIELIASTDFFSCPLDDAFANGRVAALHAASDIVASGAKVTGALANVVVPDGDVQAQRAWLTEFLAGARLELAAVKASILGGHTIVGPRAEAGFTVFGQLLGSKRFSKSGLVPGDQLYITKPLGTGVLLAAHMRGECPADAYQSLLQSMYLPQHQYVEILSRWQVGAVTDITGFGLAGHLLEMLNASGRSATIQLERLPLLLGVRNLADAGVTSSLLKENLSAASQINAHGETLARTEFNLLFDPQTCGGLLFGVAESGAPKLLEDCREIGLAIPTLIGNVTDGTSQQKLLVE